MILKRDKSLGQAASVEENHSNPNSQHIPLTLVNYVQTQHSPSDSQIANAFGQALKKKRQVSQRILREAARGVK